MTGSSPRFEGVIIPSVTPFGPTGGIDDAAVGRTLDHFVQAGVDGVLLLGTTGEGVSIPAGDRRRFVQSATDHLGGRVTVLVGIGGTCLAESIDEAGAFREAGADGFLAHLPPYYPLGAREMAAWFEDLADGLSGPLLLYNIPVTTGMSLPEEVVRDLADHAGVYGIKDSEYDDDRMERVLGWTRDRDDFAYFVGPSARSARGISLGADGVVPGVGNLLPGVFVRIVERARAGDREEADRLQEIVVEVGDTYMAGRTVSQAVAALKTGMSALGLCEPDVLPPLRQPGPDERKAVIERVEAAVMAAEGTGG